MSANLEAAIARQIRAERIAADLTQAQLGERLGWSERQIWKIENRQRVVAAHELAALCEALGCIVVDLFHKASAQDKRRLGLDRIRVSID